MNIIQKIDRTKAIALLIGTVGIYTTFVISNILFQWMTKLPYKHSTTGQQQLFRSATGLIAIERGLVWLLAEIWNYFTIPKSEQVKLPTKGIAVCGFIIFVSSITNTQAIYMVSFPLTIMVKSCNILSVILVGVLCSRVKNRSLKLENKKIIVGVVVSVGIVMFRFFDPEANFTDSNQRKTQLFGLFLLFLSLLADGFLPDWQAEIKQQYKPAPTQMMLGVNKWSCVFCVVYAIIIGQFMYTVQFCWNYPLFTIHLVSMSVLVAIGQIFIYNMIKQFKQHIVPFVVTTRKIITVGFSLLYFHHESSFGQVVGIILVFIVTLYEFLTQMMKDKFQQSIPIDGQQSNNMPEQQNLNQQSDVSGSNEQIRLQNRNNNSQN